MPKLLTGINYPDGWPDDLLREWCKHYGYPEPEWLPKQETMFWLESTSKGLKFWYKQLQSVVAVAASYPGGKKIQENFVFETWEDPKALKLYSWEAVVAPPDSNLPYPSWGNNNYSTYGKYMYPKGSKEEQAHKEELEETIKKVNILRGVK